VADATPEPPRLTLHLFESKDDYLIAAGGPGEAGRGLEATAGHFDPGANVSRIFLPSGPEAFDEVAGTYAHELTHHWVFTRCPLFKPSELARRPTLTPGFWIVEGIADFLGEGRYDVRRFDAELFNPRSLSLDLVANAAPDQLIPWERLFTLTQADFHHLDGKTTFVIPTRWRLGWLQQPTQVSMFYAQSAAVCHYLYGTWHGKSRDVLRTLVADYYTGRTTPDHVLEHTRMTPELLGKTVRDYARAMQAGRVPRPLPLAR
jgi:hypothetical protein